MKLSNYISGETQPNNSYAKEDTNHCSSRFDYWKSHKYNVDSLYAKYRKGKSSIEPYLRESNNDNDQFETMPNTVQITAIPVGGVLPTGINGFPATFGLGQFGGPGVFGGLGGLGGFGGLEGFGGLGGLGGQGGLSNQVYQAQWPPIVQQQVHVHDPIPKKIKDDKHLILALFLLALLPLLLGAILLPLVFIFFTKILLLLALMQQTNGNINGNISGNIGGNTNGNTNGNIYGNGPQVGKQRRNLEGVNPFLTTKVISLVENFSSALEKYGKKSN